MTTYLLVWALAGFLWVFLSPPKSEASEWAQLILAGPFIWLTIAVIYFLAFTGRREL